MNSEAITSGSIISGALSLAIESNSVRQRSHENRCDDCGREDCSEIPIIFYWFDDPAKAYQNRLEVRRIIAIRAIASVSDPQGEQNSIANLRSRFRRKWRFLTESTDTLHILPSALLEDGFESAQIQAGNCMEAVLMPTMSN